jgi:hypothetical protein
MDKGNQGQKAKMTFNVHQQGYKRPEGINIHSSNTNIVFNAHMIQELTARILAHIPALLVVKVATTLPGVEAGAVAVSQTDANMQQSAAAQLCS